MGTPLHHCKLGFTRSASWIIVLDLNHSQASPSVWTDLHLGHQTYTSHWFEIRRSRGLQISDNEKEVELQRWSTLRYLRRFRLRLHDAGTILSYHQRSKSLCDSALNQRGVFSDHLDWHHWNCCLPGRSDLWGGWWSLTSEFQRRSKERERFHT